MIPGSTSIMSSPEAAAEPTAAEEALVARRLEILTAMQWATQQTGYEPDAKLKAWLAIFAEQI